MPTNSGGPAFPAPNFAVPHDLANEKIVKLLDLQGMTLRDYFAGKELSKSGGIARHDQPESYARLAEHCYRMADAMLAARNS